MKAVPAIIDQLEEKIKTVTQKVELLRQENKLLHEENEKMNKELKSREKLIRELEDQRNLFSGFATSPKVNQRKMAHTLDQYIKQVDQCIEMVSNLG